LAVWIVGMESIQDAFSEVASSPWALTAISMLGAIVLGRIIVIVFRAILHRAARRTQFTWDDEIINAIATPLSIMFAIQAFRIALPWLPIDHAAAMTKTAITIGTTLCALWIGFRAVDIARSILAQRAWAIARPASRSLLSIGSRFMKVTVAMLGTIMLLAQLGVSVTSLIAGLGIGGLALALAAQKTVENLFGTLSIGVDQPMREGDFVKIYDFVGTVEEIGLRSTRVRTLDRTLITIPNGELANQRIESFAVRDRIRLACVLGLLYQTTAAQMRGVLADLERVLRDHPKIWPDAVVVRFRELASSSLDIEVMAWFQTTDWNEFQAIRQDVLLRFMEVVEGHGAGFAFPTQTLHVDSLPALQSNGVTASREAGQDRSASTERNVT
jgi:MscS family membrane protein